jgi:hypothetical protein
LTTKSSHRALRHSYVRNTQSTHTKLVLRFSQKNPVKSFFTFFHFFSLNSYRGLLKTEVPRHNEIVDELARKICKDLEISFIR